MENSGFQNIKNLKKREKHLLTGRASECMLFLFRKCGKPQKFFGKKEEVNMAEYLDILGEDLLPTGETATRERVHREGLLHSAVIVAIVDENNRILIQKRAEEKEKYGGLWDVSVAGHTPAGHYEIDTTFLESMEEVNISIPIVTHVANFKGLRSFLDKRVIKQDGKPDFIENQLYTVYMLFPNIEQIRQIRVQKSEVSAVDWKTMHEIREMMAEGLFHPRTKWLDVVYPKLAQLAFRGKTPIGKKQEIEK